MHFNQPVNRIDKKENVSCSPVVRSKKNQNPVKSKCCQKIVASKA